jgi:hypothetical protein
MSGKVDYRSIHDKEMNVIKLESVPMAVSDPRHPMRFRSLVFAVGQHTGRKPPCRPSLMDKAFAESLRA